jgi:D-lyxose ketol-isomerase
MEELDKALDICLRGPQADDALARCAAHLRAWGCAMPAVTPLVLDFGLGDFTKVGLIEYWIANEKAAGYCGKYLFVFDGQTCPMHRHKVKMETFFVVQGQLRIIYDGRELILGPGGVLPVQPWHYHSFTGHHGPALLLEVSQPCEVDDNYFENQAIPIGGNHQPRK